MTYSIDFRKKVLSIKDKEKMSFEAVSKRFGVGKNTVFVWTKKILPLKCRNKAPTKILPDKLKEDVEQYSDAYQYERAERLGVSRSGIQQALKRLSITYKKSSKTSEGKRRERLEFQNKIEKYKEQGKIITFTDESGFVYSAPRTHGYSAKGTRCYRVHDWHPSKRANVIGALVGKYLLTVSIFDCNVNTAIFNCWVEQDLIPKLPSNSVVVMDNAAFLP